VPFESLGAVFYSPSILIMAVCEIFSVKELHNLENQVRGRSRSLKMALFGHQDGGQCIGVVEPIVLFVGTF